jgi:hypothetical protein
VPSENRVFLATIAANMARTAGTCLACAGVRPCFDVLGVSKPHLSDVDSGRRVVSVERAGAWAKLWAYDAGQFVELALQAEFDAVGIKLKVSVEAA